MILNLLAATAATSSSVTGSSILSGAFEYISLIVAVGAAIALIFAYAKRDLAKNTIELQDKQINAQKERIDTLEAAREEDARQYKATVDSLETKVKKLEASVTVLENMKSGTDAVAELGLRMNDLSQTNHQLLNQILIALQGLSQPASVQLAVTAK